MWWLKIAVFFALIVILYFQIRTIEWSNFTNITIQRPMFLVLGVLLVILNIGSELLKWKIVLNQSAVESNLKHSLKSLLSGFAIGAIGFNGVGNFLGRIVWFSKRERWKLTFLTFYTNYSQLILTLSLGALFYILFPFKELGFSTLNLILVVVGILLLFSIYFFPSIFKFLFNKWTNIQSNFVSSTKVMNRISFQILGVSLFRYCVFSLQYFLILSSFLENVSLEVLLLIPQIYFVSSIIPSLLIGKLVIRESVSLLVLTVFVQDEIVILLSSLIIWVVNIVLPALLGLIIITFWKDAERV